MLSMDSTQRNLSVREESMMCTNKEEENTKATLEFINGEIDARDYSKRLVEDNLAESSPIRSFTIDFASTAVSGILDKIHPSSEKEGP